MDQLGSGQVANKLTDKWRGTGLLEGLTDYQQDTIARGLENQAHLMLQSERQDLDLLMPLARAVVLKVMDSLVTVDLPAFVIANYDFEGRVETAAVASWRYGVSVTAEELKAPTPGLVERLSTDMAQSLLTQKGDKTTIYLYTPALLFEIWNGSYSLTYRATFR